MFRPGSGRRGGRGAHSAGAAASSPNHAPAPAVTRAALHQCHLKSSVPSLIKCKRCRKVTARRGLRMYSEPSKVGESGGGNEKVFTRKRGVCGDRGTCNGGGHADQSSTP